MHNEDLIHLSGQRTDFYSKIKSLAVPIESAWTNLQQPIESAWTNLQQQINLFRTLPIQIICPSMPTDSRRSQTWKRRTAAAV